MNYAETLDFLYTSTPVFQRVGASAYKANLDNTNALDEYFGHPHTKFKTVHVAGTNGKGSVSHMLAAVLQTAGYKVGLYTSPHLHDFRERIRIDGQMIPEADVVDFVAKHRAVIEDIKPSFFELTVSMAFDYFARSGVDIAVIEVGMGGRLDSTNIINPLLSVITNISRDHTQFLGKTLGEIAGEKAGIIKPGVPVVVGEWSAETSDVFISKASACNSPIYFADRIYSCERSEKFDGSQRLSLRNISNNEVFEVTLDLSGDYQRRNILTVMAAVDQLNTYANLGLSRDIVLQGLRSAARATGLMGRWQVLCAKPYTVCDTAHNEAGIREVVSQLKQHKYNKLYIVFGMVNDKDPDSILPLMHCDAYYFFTRASVERALDPSILARKAADYGLCGEITGSVSDALAAARRLAKPDDMIYIGGSTFIVAEIETMSC